MIPLTALYDITWFYTVNVNALRCLDSSVYIEIWNEDLRETVDTTH
jgi:hypothetical protein